MNKDLKKTIILSVIIFLFIGFIGMALITPPRDLKVLGPADDDIAVSFSSKDISTASGCLIDGNKISLEREDPYIAFENLEKTTNIVAIRFAKPLTSSISARMFYLAHEVYSEADSVVAYGHPGTDFIVFVLPTADYTALRFDFYNEIEIKGLELHSGGLKEVPFSFPLSAKKVVLVLFAGLFAAALFFVLDRKFKVTANIFNKKPSFKGAVIYALAFVACAAFSVFVEYILGKFSGANSAGVTFNIHRLSYIFGVLAVIALLAINFKLIAEKVEIFVFGVIIILGLVTIGTSCFAHESWDIDSHFKWVVNASYLGQNYVTESDAKFYYVDPSSVPKENAKDNIADIITLNDNSKYLNSINNDSTIASHVPSGVFLAVGRFLGLPYYYRVSFAKFANVLLYALLCFFAVKKIKSGKMILSIIALFPTNIFLASNFAYDTWVVGFVFLGMAYFVAEMQEPDKPVSIKDTVIMCSSFLIACLPKEIYILFLLIPFFMPTKKIEKKKLYYAICTLAIIVLAVLLGVRTLGLARGGGDFRGGENVNTLGQIKFILGNPVKFAKIFFNFYKDYISTDNMYKSISNFAYLGFGKYTNVFILLLAVATVSDKNEYDLRVKNPLFRVYGVVMYLVSAAMVIGALYVSFNEIGSTTILGCQARYITPLLYPSIALLVTKVDNKINRTAYNLVMLLPCVVVNFVDIALVQLSRWA